MLFRSYPICGVYDVNPSKFGQVSNVVRQDVYKNWTQVYNGFQVAINARFGHGFLLSGGVNTAQTIFDTCTVADVPAQNCHQSLPYRGQTQIKFIGAAPLPWGLLLSATFLSLPGFPDNATLTYSNAQIAPKDRKSVV